MKLRQIPIEERVEIIEKFLVFGFLAIAVFIDLTQNKANFFGVNTVIFDLIVFFISFPLFIYYFFIISLIVGGRYGDSVDNFIQKYKSKLEKPFLLCLVLISGLIMYQLGKELKDIISSILLIFIAVVVKKVFIEKKK